MWRSTYTANPCHLLNCHVLFDDSVAIKIKQIYIRYFKRGMKMPLTFMNAADTSFSNSLISCSLGFSLSCKLASKFQFATAKTAVQ